MYTGSNIIYEVKSFGKTLEWSTVIFEANKCFSLCCCGVLYMINRQTGIKRVIDSKGL